MTDINARLLAFAESVANSRSGNLHGFYSGMVTEARQIVKAAGGRLDKIGRYEQGSAAWKPHGKYAEGRWIQPVLDRETDTWTYPET